MTDKIFTELRGALIFAPWTGSQVDALNRWQRLGHVHPFTCGNDADHPSDEPFSGDRTLVATRTGWICCHCDYKQTWAHASMLELPSNPFDAVAAVDEVTARAKAEEEARTAVVRRQRGIIQRLKTANGVLRGTLLAVQEWRVPYRGLAEDEGSNGVIEHFREVASVALEWEPPK